MKSGRRRATRGSALATASATLVLALGFAGGPALAGTCPVTPEDTVVPISDPTPPARAGEPELSIDGVTDFIAQEGITDVKAFMSALPQHMRSNYVLIEETQGLGRTSLEHPGILMFGSDARFMLNISSDPDDPRYEVVDMAHMDPKTGDWTFRSLDFDQSPPKLSDNDAQCRECHGNPARPFWGEYLDWPGVFGNNEAQPGGPEQLIARQARRLNELRAGQRDSDRFHALAFLDGNRAYQANRAMFLPDHDYGFALTMINSEMGGAVAESIFLRMKQSPNYKDLREELILLGFCDSERRIGRAERDSIAEVLKDLGSGGSDINALYDVLGIDREHELSLDRFPGEEPNLFWNAGTTYIAPMVQTLVLNDLAEDERAVRDILRNGPNNRGIFACPTLGRNTDEVLRFKMVHGYSLRGEARQAVQRAFYDPDLFRVFSPVLKQVASPLCRHLAANIGRAPGGGQVGQEPDPDPTPDPPRDPDPGATDPNPACPAVDDVASLARSR